ncbi:hypothetical protein GHK92_08505 [Nocardioides sp. dk4132]|uniref:hypothetical protein n=1 Tax=unclassified Nocardioides TaxID=2615069 RepID=UPI00129643F2|nr:MULTISPECIES: hypothetical protein [unclassified Nocardioides]MQW75912.1 hypothetical protein [Nocardioides sp. dk4132]QGA08773.1 hypothetical protein GFH29_16265 [Nocardioides sp. dk884]
MLRRVTAALAALATAAVIVPAAAPPAHAAGRVTVVNDRGSAAIDDSYSTTLTVSGSGFQSVKGGHGGVYVWFGTVSGAWQPSKGGVSGENYVYVPDSESKNNAGHQRYVAFPGSDTAASANGGSMSENGSWRVQLVVPGPVFEAVGRNGSVRTVDCREVTCGVITIGAHGVKNANNETFTPLPVREVYADQPAGSEEGAATEDTSSEAGSGAGTSTGSGSGAGAGAAAGSGAGESGTPTTAPGSGKPARGAKPALEVDRASASVGNVLSFTGSGLPAGRQVTVVLDDGAAAAGPFLVGADGGIAGVIGLPADTRPGTHELRVFGVEDAPTVSFAVTSADDAEETSAEEEEDSDRAAVVFAAAAGVVLLAALVLTILRLRRSRRAAR